MQFGSFELLLFRVVRMIFIGMNFLMESTNFVCIICTSRDAVGMPLPLLIALFVRPSSQSGYAFFDF